MIGRLAHMDEATRRRFFYMAVAAAGLLSYRLFTDGPVRQLRAVQVEHEALVQRQAEMDFLNVDLEQLRKDFDSARKSLQEMQAQCVDPAEALSFLEGLNTIAIAHGLQPASTTLPPPRRLFADAAFGLGDRVMVRQAEVVVSGEFGGLLGYLEELMLGHGKIFLSGLRITSESDGAGLLRASFQVSIVVATFNEGQP